MAIKWNPVQGNLVSWLKGPPKNVGVVAEVSNHNLKVEFDTGDSTFKAR